MQQREETGIIISLSRIDGFSPLRRFSFLATAAVFVPRVVSVGEEALGCSEDGRSARDA